MKKRLLSILLVFVMMLSALPTPAFAEDGGEEAPVCICETACTAEDMNADCPVCGAEGAHLHDCAKYVEGTDDAMPQSEDVKEEQPVCSCETACMVEVMNADCPVCSAEGAHLHDCAKYVKPADDAVTPPEDVKEEPPVCTCETACTVEAMNADCLVCGVEGASAENCEKYTPGEGEQASEPDNTPAITAADVQALINALPEAETISEENAADVEAQLEAIDAAKVQLSEEDLAALDFTRYEAAAAALLTLLGEPGTDFALQADHTHCYCGGDVTAGDHTGHSDAAYTAWNGTSGISYTNGTAYVYLTDNATINSNLVVDGTTLYLCLNGNTYASNGTNKIQVKNGGRLVLCDCQGGGTIKGATSGWGGMCIYLYKSTLDMFGGKLTGGKVTGKGGGGAIAMDDQQCIFNMYGGEISGNNGKNYGGAIFRKFNANMPNTTGGVFNMYGGVIRNNTASNGGAFFSTTGGTVNMTGGTISGNKATQNSNNAGGGAIYLRGSGIINISGSAQITGNASSLDGGAILMGWGTVNISGSAKINNNTASRWGGAICLRQDSNQSTTLYMRGGEISGNKANSEGGAVHVLDKDCQFFLYDGKITGNTSGDGGAIYLNQEPSWLIMQGGEISGNTATGNGGGVYIYRSGSVCEFYGGKIENNKAGGNGGGIYINPSNSGQLKVGNTAVAQGNTVSGKANNVYLPSGKTLSIGIGMSTGSSVGVTIENTSYPVAFSNAYGRNYATCFFADDANAYVEYKDDQKLYLVAGTEYTLTFDANGGTGAPAAMTGGTNRFVIPDTVPTRENAHFGGWAVTAESDSPQYQPGGTVTIDDGMKMTLYAYWKTHGDGDGDGFCDGGGECIHEKDTDGYCTVSSCTHNAGGRDCCPKRGPLETVITTLPTLPAETYVGTQFLDEALKGGVAKVKGTDTVVPGKFTFQGKYGGSVSVAGENRLKVIFTPDDTEAYTTAECEVIVTGIKHTITEVLTKFTITDKPLGTPLVELRIPTEGVMVKTNSGAMFAPIPVIWDTSTYDPNSLETQIICGTLDVANSYYSDRIVTETNVKATIEVSLIDTRVFKTTIVTPPAVEGTFYALDRYETLTSALKGGKAMANGQEIEGTFEFDENELLYGETAYPGVGLKYGQLTRTVVFKPTNSRNYTTATCTVTVNVLPLTIVEINPYFEDITDKPIGTAFEQLGLAEAGSMDVMRDDPQRTTAMSDTVVWDKNRYDPNTPYEQHITGRLVLSMWKDYITPPPEEMSAVSVKVKLKYDPVAPVIVTAPTFRWTKGDFRLGDNQIFVSAIFQIGTETHPEEPDEIGALIGGEARVNGKKIDGTFSFKAGTPKWFSAAGINNVTVVFTPSDAVLYAPAECTIPIEAVKRTLLSIESSTDITDKEAGTEFDALGLPSFVHCRTEDGSFYSGIGVTWDKTSYDPNSTAEQTVTGTLNLSDIPTIQQPVPELKATIKVKLLPHEWGDWTPDGNGAHTRVCARNSSHKETNNCSGGMATCKEKAVCSVCGQAYGQLAAHDFTAEVAEEKYLKSAATCTEKAAYYKSCIVCGEKGTETFEVGNILGHDWGEWQSNGNGAHTRVCARNSSHKETNNCSGGTSTCQAKAVCSVCGQTYGQLAAHDFTAELAEEKYLKSAATCTEKAVYYKSCTVCGEKGTETFEVGNILGHDWGEWQSNGNGTHSRVCARDNRHKETKDCSGGTATCQAKAVCDLCKHEYGQLGAHSFTAETVAEQYLKSAATCTEKAAYYKSCATCGLSSKGADGEAAFETKALGHDWDKWQSNGDGTHTRVCKRDDTHKETASCSGGTATCVEKATCKDCGGKYGEKDAANHTGTKEWTTTKTTHEQKWSCCGDVVVAKESHTFGDWVVTKKATSKKAGEKTRTCEVCDYTETAEIPATGTGGLLSPKTGDDSHIGMWAGILCISLAGIVALIVWRKRKNKR